MLFIDIQTRILLKGSLSRLKYRVFIIILWQGACLLCCFEMGRNNGQK